MKFMIKDAQGQESGPFELQELEQFILQGRIHGDTPVRAELLPRWNRIDQMTQLTAALADAAAREEARPLTFREKIFGRENPEEKDDAARKDTTFRNRSLPQPAGGIIRLLTALTDAIPLGLVALLLFLIGLAEAYVAAGNSTVQVAPASAESAKTAAPAENAAASASPRTNSTDSKPDAAPKKPSLPENKAVTDAAKAVDALAAKEKELAAQVRLDNAAATAPPTNNDGADRNYRLGSIWTVAATGERFVCLRATPGQARWVTSATLERILGRGFIIGLFVFLLYFGLCLGLLAQTFGMWFWGSFVVKPNYTEPVFLFRAFCFSFLILLFGPLAVLTALLPRGYGIHDLLTGVRVIRTVPRKRY